MTAYDNYLVNGAALRTVLEDVHGDQQRQDGDISSLQASQPQAIGIEELAEIWNNS